MKDKQIEKLIRMEKERQKKVINLIASENYVSNDVKEALSSPFINKYAEGYPGKRYYCGQQNTDPLEELTKKRALKLFKLKEENWAVNVQVLSGAYANLAVYSALVPLHAKIMSMALSSGGHLSHGQSVSMTGKIWHQVSYSVDQKTELIDYDELKKIALSEKPALIVAGFTAYPRIIDWQKFREIADLCGALLLVDMSHIAGLVAGGVYPSPFPFADVVTTTTQKTLRGPRSAMIFSRVDEREINKKIDKAVFPGLQGGPFMHQIAAVSVALNEASSSSFKKYAKQIIKNSKALALEFSKLGWRIISGGTDSHLILIDTWMDGKGISGDEAAKKLEKNNIIVNKNTIPFDTRKPTDPSGIRLGVAAETTRGKTEKDFIKIAKKIDQILKGI